VASLEGHSQSTEAKGLTFVGARHFDSLLPALQSCKLILSFFGEDSRAAAYCLRTRKHITATVT